MSDRNGNFLHVDRLAIPTLTPERKHYPALHTSVRMAPAHCAWPGWLDLGDAVAIAYGPSEGYAGAADPKDAARYVIHKVSLDLGRSSRGRLEPREEFPGSHWHRDRRSSAARSLPRHVPSAPRS